MAPMPFVHSPDAIAADAAMEPERPVPLVAPECMTRIPLRADMQQADFTDLVFRCPELGKS